MKTVAKSLFHFFTYMVGFNAKPKKVSDLAGKFTSEFERVKAAQDKEAQKQSAEVTKAQAKLDLAKDEARKAGNFVNNFKKLTEQ